MSDDRPTYGDALELPRDDGGQVVGYQVGKAAALSEWAIRKEINDPEFEALCERLYKAKWARENRERLAERVAASQRRWRAANPDAVKRHSLARRKPPVKQTCQECGGTFEQVRLSKFCSLRCRRRPTARRRAKQRNQGLRDMTAPARVFAILRETPWLRLGEILERDPSLKYGSTATVLSNATKRGELVHDGAKHRRRYAVAGMA